MPNLAIDMSEKTMNVQANRIFFKNEKKKNLQVKIISRNVEVLTYLNIKY